MKEDLMSVREVREDERAPEQVSVETPFIKARFEGKHVSNLLRFLIFVLLTLLLVLGYLFAQENKGEHAAMKNALDAQTLAITEQTYVLTLSQPQREALNLAMPDSLRKRMR